MNQHIADNPQEDDFDDEAQSPFSRGREIRQQVIDMEEEGVLFLDPPEIFDAAIVGLTEGAMPVRVVYDRNRCIEQMARHGSGQWEDASESFEFNILNAGVGENGPMFISCVDPLPRRKDEPKYEPALSHEYVTETEGETG